jgi:hypothetical protein
LYARMHPLQLCIWARTGRARCARESSARVRAHHGQLVRRQRLCGVQPGSVAHQDLVPDRDARERHQRLLDRVHPATGTVPIRMVTRGMVMWSSSGTRNASYRRVMGCCVSTGPLVGPQSGSTKQHGTTRSRFPPRLRSDVQLQRLSIVGHQDQHYSRAGHGKRPHERPDYMQIRIRLHEHICVKCEY